jgi:anti-sigma-K factor RskA
LNIQEYIKSGIIESYILGLLEDEEAKELEGLLSTSPELQIAMQEFEQELEATLRQNEYHPPVKVWSAIQHRIQLESLFGNTGTATDSKKNDYIPIEAQFNSHIRVHKYWKHIFIVVFILSKVFLAFAIYYYIEYKNAIEAMQRLHK